MVSKQIALKNRSDMQNISNIRARQSSSESMLPCCIANGPYLDRQERAANVVLIGSFFERNPKDQQVSNLQKI